MQDIAETTGWPKKVSHVSIGITKKNAKLTWKTKILLESSDIPGESKKYTRLTSHNTASFASILKIRLELDR